MKNDNVPAPGLNLYAGPGGISFRIWTEKEGGGYEVTEYPLTLQQAAETGFLLLKHVGRIEYEQEQQLNQKAALEEAALLAEAGRQAVQQ